MLESALDAKWICYPKSSSCQKLPNYVETNWKTQQSQYMYMSCGHKVLGCIEQLRPASLTVLMYFLGHLLDEFKAGDAQAVGSVMLRTPSRGFDICCFCFFSFFFMCMSIWSRVEHPMPSVSVTGYPTPNHPILSPTACWVCLSAFSNQTVHQVQRDSCMSCLLSLMLFLVSWSTVPLGSFGPVTRTMMYPVCAWDCMRFTAFIRSTLQGNQQHNVLSHYKRRMNWQCEAFHKKGKLIVAIAL